MNIVAIDFYKKGVSVSIDTPAIDPLTMAATWGETKKIGYSPSEDDKQLSGPAYGRFSNDGKSYLALKGGHIYDLTIKLGSTEQKDVISAEHGDVVIPVENDMDIKVKKHKDSKE